jgi:hypothetical protein
MRALPVINPLMDGMTFLRVLYLLVDGFGSRSICAARMWAAIIAPWKLMRAQRASSQGATAK